LTLKARTIVACASPVLFVVLSCLWLLPLGSQRATAEPLPVQQQEWVTTWGASPVAVKAGDNGSNNQTLRLIVHTSVGGGEARVRLSNVFGARPLVIGEARIAVRSSGADIDPGTDHAIAFNGARSVTVPPGQFTTSDAVRLDVRPFSDLAVSIYLPGPAGPSTTHPLALCENYVAEGDVVGAVQFPAVQTYRRWPFLAGIEVRTAAHAGAIVAFGDSITDGFGSTVGADHRWPNFLSHRLAGLGVNLAVVNEGISGNGLLHEIAGPTGLSRFERDVLDQTGVKYIIVLLGTNDIGLSQRPATSVTADEIIAGYRQLIARAHDRGLKIIGRTLTPFGGSGYDPPPDEANSPREVMREAVNRFIRTSGAFDGVIDFDAAVRDPAHPVRFLPAYDSGDHLHPSDAGYQAMAEAIDLSLFHAPSPRVSHSDRAAALFLGPHASLRARRDHEPY
jgi:lysophospholipase L1-like esterase